MLSAFVDSVRKKWGQPLGVGRRTEESRLLLNIWCVRIAVLEVINQKPPCFDACFTPPSPPRPPPLPSLYNALFWYGGASEDAEQLPAMNFQDLLERFDSIAGDDSPGKLRVRGGRYWSRCKRRFRNKQR